MGGGEVVGRGERRIEEGRRNPNGQARRRGLVKWVVKV